MYVGDPSAIDAFQAQHEAALEADFNTVRSQDILFEILPKGASKASALQALSQTLGYRRDQVMALGDANNDLEMLRFAGYSVAMGNGNAAVKEIADFITLTNDEDGVAHAIHKLIETEKRMIMKYQNCWTVLLPNVKVNTTFRRKFYNHSKYPITS